MILDKQNEYSLAQAVTVTAGSTNQIDHGPVATGNTTRDLGAGTPVELFINVDETVTSDSAATVTFSLETDTVSTFNDATVTLWTSTAIGKATLVAGHQIKVKLPRGEYKRFTRLKYTCSHTLTAGKFTAGLTLAQQDNRTYVSGSTIS